MAVCFIQRTALDIVNHQCYQYIPIQQNIFLPSQMQHNGDMVKPESIFLSNEEYFGIYNYGMWKNRCNTLVIVRTSIQTLVSLWKIQKQKMKALLFITLLAVVAMSGIVNDMNYQQDISGNRYPKSNSIGLMSGVKDKTQSSQKGIVNDMNYQHSQLGYRYSKSNSIGLMSGVKDKTQSSQNDQMSPKVGALGKIIYVKQSSLEPQIAKINKIVRANVPEVEGLVFVSYKFQIVAGKNYIFDYQSPNQIVPPRQQHIRIYARGWQYYYQITRPDGSKFIEKGSQEQKNGTSN